MLLKIKEILIQRWWSITDLKKTLGQKTSSIKPRKISNVFLTLQANYYYCWPIKKHKNERNSRPSDRNSMKQLPFDSAHRDGSNEL